MSSVGEIVTFTWLEEPSPRLAESQVQLLSSINELGLSPLPYPAGRNLVLLGDVLQAARDACCGQAFVWCNSDVVLTRNPFDVPDHGRVYGFHRREIPSGETALGVDMYYIPTKWWDEYLCKDIPELCIGASYVDWWISRAMEKAGAYENLKGYIDHLSHGKSEAAADDSNPYYQSNFRAYNRWARRQGLAPVPAPPYLLPRIGHVWGLRDVVNRIRDIRTNPPQR